MRNTKTHFSAPDFSAYTNLVRLAFAEWQMVEPLFPIGPQQVPPTDAVRFIEPYRYDGAWVFDDPTTGLVREPFVGGVTAMIDRLAAHIADAANGFRLFFATYPF